MAPLPLVPKLLAAEAMAAWVLLLPLLPSPPDFDVARLVAVLPPMPPPPPIDCAKMPVASAPKVTIVLLTELVAVTRPPALIVPPLPPLPPRTTLALYSPE